MPQHNTEERFESSNVIGKELFSAFTQPPAPVDRDAFGKKLVEVITQATQRNSARDDILFFSDCCRRESEKCRQRLSAVHTLGAKNV